MSDTPRTDLIRHNIAELGVFSRQLERGLNAAYSRIAKLEKQQRDDTKELEQQDAILKMFQERIQRLVEAGDAMFGVLEMYGEEIRREWTKAKEGL